MTRRTERASSERITPDDPRYQDLVRRGFNKRFAGRPDYVSMVASTEQVIEALESAVREGLRPAVRSGGHCLEGFVDEPAVRVLLDTSAMTGVCYDPAMNAFAVEAGTRLGEVYRRLCLGWGVLLPAGQSPEVGIGGHVLGGAHGFLHRQHGLAADHLYAVEVVVVDGSGRACAVVATREATDPNRELWWAHTGGGGGNFGIVTRYWFRSPDADGTDPGTLLPRAPDSVWVFRADWQWDDLDEAAFVRLAANFGDWCERNSDADSARCRVFSMLSFARQPGGVALKGLVTGPDAEQLANEHLAAIGAGLSAPRTSATERLSWLGFALRPFPELFVPGLDNVRVKAKDAVLRKRFSDDKMRTAYDYLTRPDYDVPGGALVLMTYGGRVNAVARDATACAQRAAVIDIACSTGWLDPSAEAQILPWVRAFYRDLFADTGGVPVPGANADGALINHPDTDLADPAWNTSGIPWHAIYYQGNYPRLQQIKAQYDPRNVFRHALSIQPALSS